MTGRSPAETALLALLLEVAATPTPGNVDRVHDHPDLRFEQFLAGGVGALGGLDLAARDDVGLGRAFERSVAGMAEQRGGNTQFGALLLLVVLVRAGAIGDLSPAGAAAVTARTDTEDAVAFYEATEHVAIAAADPPEGFDSLDVRRGSDAIPAVRDREIDLSAILTAGDDAVASEWASGFERSFAVADRLCDREGPVLDRAATVWLETLAEHPDALIAIQHDRETAAWASDRARAVLEGAVDADRVATEFHDRSINPGATADLLAAGLFVALRRGLTV